MQRRFLACDIVELERPLKDPHNLRLDVGGMRVNRRAGVQQLLGRLDEILFGCRARMTLQRAL